jgi:5-methylcytosine-specific restriction endonuclease McrA
MTIEHLIAKRDGGTNAIENLRIACYYCNHFRHNNIAIHHHKSRIPSCARNRTI